MAHGYLPASLQQCVDKHVRDHIIVGLLRGLLDRDTKFGWQLGEYMTSISKGSRLALMNSAGAHDRQEAESATPAEGSESSMVILDRLLVDMAGELFR